MSCHWQTRRNRDTITFDEWVDLDLSRSGKGIANAYRNFVVRCKHEAAVVVLTAPAMGGRVAFCFKQPSVDEVNGFRRGLNLYRYAVSHTPYGDERVEKKQIENAAQLWKRDPLIGIHGIPDLNGAWVGEGISNCEVDGEPVRYDMRLDITQTFSKMECKSKFTNSESANHIIGVHGCNPKRQSCILEFSYRNEAREKAVVDEGWDDEHRGFNWIECEGDSMAGRYFTNRREPTRGSFSLTREPNA